MAWHPNTTPTADTSAILKSLEGYWPQGAEKVEAVRLQAGREPQMSLGSYDIEEHDSPSHVVEFLASACAADCEALGGEARRYELKVHLRRKRNRKATAEVEIAILGILRLGTGDPASPGGNIMKEAGNLIGKIGESEEKRAAAEERRADADVKRHSAIGSGFDVMARMIEGMGTLVENTSQIGANHVKIAELKLGAEREERAERKEEAQRKQEEEWATAREAKVFGMLGVIGQQLAPFVPGFMAALIMNMQATAAARAKDAGVTVPGFTPAAPQPGPTVRQVHEIRDALVGLLNSLDKSETAKVKKIVGDDVWSILQAAAAAEDDDACLGVLVKLGAVVDAMGPRAVEVFGQLGNVLGQERFVVFNSILEKIPRPRRKM